MNRLMNYKFLVSKQIIVLLGLSIGLNFLRIAIFSNYSFVYMFWNIFLALLPLLFSSILYIYDDFNKLSKSFFVIGSLIWLFFLPNSFYLITDLIHIDHSRSVPILFDAIMFFVCAELGLYLGLHSITHIEHILDKRFTSILKNRLLILIIILSSFGIYLGRFLRFNSWDILTNPLSLFKSICEIFIHPIVNIDALLYTLLFFVLIYMAYRFKPNEH